MKFYLGTHIANWIDKIEDDLFISIRTLRKRKNKKFNQKCKLFIDSGGFTELNMYGKWKTTPFEYVQELKRLKKLGLKFEWVSPQDWMVEPFVLEKTGLTILEHQKRTINNLIELRNLTNDFHFIPVLQGWKLSDYINHLTMYEECGFNLKNEKIVGLGSVCRRQNTNEIEQIVKHFYSIGLNLHGFGVKKTGLQNYGFMLKSADSMAWSFNARYTKKCSLCQDNNNKNCANCLNYALQWKNEILRC